MIVTKEYRAVAGKDGYLYLNTLADTPHEANNLHIMQKFDITYEVADKKTLHEDLWHKCHAEGDRNVRVKVTFTYP